MRRRAVRELGTVAGVIVILLALVLANTQMRRQGLKEQMESWRQAIEQERSEGGLELLKWPLLQKTRGGRKDGPRFHEDLKAMQDQQVDLIGFMQPIDEFRMMNEFLLLPMPIECYFCERPPMKDIVYVTLAEGQQTMLYEEPVLINGVLRLNEGPGTKFFYVIEDAQLGAGEEDGKLHQRTIPREHRVPAHMTEPAEEDLLEGQEPPAPVAE